MDLAHARRADQWPIVQSATSSDGLDEGARLLLYWQIIRSRLNLLGLSVLCATLLTFVVTTFIETPRYRAIAILRPVDTQAAISRLWGMVGAPPIGAGRLREQQTDAKAEEFVSILTSYSFTSKLISQYGLAGNLEGKPSRIWPFHVDHSRWNLYHVMLGRFSSQYHSASGNLVLRFVDPSPERARAILQIYIQSLRTQLRRAAVQDARLAAAELSRQARAASDTFLQEQLYGFVAAQLQRKDLADVDADFAFRVIEPPVVPDTPYQPKIPLDCVLAALVSTFLSTLAVIAVDSKQAQ